jgi:excisionase family DNA binding protein
MALDDWMTTSEAAEIIGVSKIRVLQFYHEGRLNGERIGQQVLFRKADVRSFARQDRPHGRPRIDR